MNEANLMPEWALRKQQRRHLWLRLAGVEAVIIMVLAVVMAGLYAWAATSLRTADRLELLLRDEKFRESEQIAEAVKASEVRFQARSAMRDALETNRFDYTKLEAIRRTLPEGVVVTEIDMREGYFTLSATAADLTRMERHRGALTVGAGFEWVRYGPSARQEDGTLRYTLTLK